MTIEKFNQIRSEQADARHRANKLRIEIENSLTLAAKENLNEKVFISEGKEYRFSHLDLNFYSLDTIYTYGFVKTKSGYSKQATRMYDIKLTPEQILTGVI